MARCCITCGGRAAVNLSEALQQPDGPEPRAARPPAEKGWTPGYVWNGSQGTIVTQPLAEQPHTWDEFIRDAGLDPAEVVVVGPCQFRGWDAATGNGNVQRMRYYRINVQRLEDVRNIDDLIKIVKAHRPRKVPPPDGPGAFVIALGDLQFGKGDGDGPAGTLQRYLDGIDAAVAELKALRKMGQKIGQIHLALLGDHLEGFVSQGGTNAWRTKLPLTYQYRAVRRLIMYAVQRLANLAPRMTIVAVPGNHGEAVRFGSKLTTFDDNWDTEALIAVGDALALNPDSFGHVQIRTPATDELTVTLDVAGTIITHAHGHQIKRGKHFEWWAGQSLGDFPPGAAHMLLVGHLHHLHVDTFGPKTFLQVPALEAESTYYRHMNGVPGHPGIATFYTHDGAWSHLSIV